MVNNAPLVQRINPLLFWERHVIPFRIKQNASHDEKAWPEYITYVEKFPEEHEDRFVLSNKQTSDGRMELTLALVWSVLEPVVFMRCVSNRYKGRKDYNAVKYQIGPILITNDVSGSVLLPGSKFKQRGNIEIASMPVISTPHTISQVRH